MDSGKLQNDQDAGAEPPRRLCVYNAGFFTQARLRRILALAGWRVTLGRPGRGDWVGVWGDAATAHRGRAMAARSGARILSVEDAFLRSLRPARLSGEPPLGLLLDRTGLHFDASRPSDLETLLATHPLDDTALLDRARDAMARIARLRLSKYSAFDPDLPPPEPGYVLVIDQARGDASVRASVPGAGGDVNRFAEMLFAAQEEHPGARILIRAHPETTGGGREGHFRAGQAQGRISFVTGEHAPAVLFEGAVAVYTLSSQMGFEAILAGHRPRVFGAPFYAGWGLSDDALDFARRRRKLTRAQLFAAAMILYPTWFDPHEQRLCRLERVIDTLEAQTRAWMQDRKGWIGHNIRAWKRPHMRAFFGRHRAMRFARALPDPACETRRVMSWGSAAPPTPALWRVEDGFLRSRGLGAKLVPPVSLILDDLGLYYDPARESRVERLIAASPSLPQAELRRAAALRERIVAGGHSKYGLSGAPPEGAAGAILVPGQVADDASVLAGGGGLDNSGLLARVRQENPGARILYRPHPDVAAGLRPGVVADPLRWADAMVGEADLAALLGEVRAVWTLTSLTGFEALLRGVEVVTLGAPFYAGWGLTRDLGTVPARRRFGRVTLDGLVHAALIGAPRYLDPRTGLPCPVEVALDRLAAGETRAPRRLRMLAAAQGLLRQD